jgi:hypothetical protein
VAQSCGSVEVDFLGLKLVAPEKLALFGLTVTKVDLTRQGVEVEVIKGLLLDLLSYGTDALALHPPHHRHRLRRGLDDVHLARNQLDLGILEVASGTVGECDPAVEAHGFALLGCHDIGGGYPIETAGEVGKLGVEVSGSRSPNLPGKGGSKNVVVAQGGKMGWPGRLNWRFPSTLMMGL